MTQDEALQLAFATAQEKGWPEKLRVSVTGGRKYFLFGPYLWHVHMTRSSANLSAWITIDDSSGQVIDIATGPLNPNRKPSTPADPDESKEV